MCADQEIEGDHWLEDDRRRRSIFFEGYHPAVAVDAMES
jgi:hypothetical protein